MPSPLISFFALPSRSRTFRLKSLNRFVHSSHFSVSANFLTKNKIWPSLFQPSPHSFHPSKDFSTIGRVLPSTLFTCIRYTWPSSSAVNFHADALIILPPFLSILPPVGRPVNRKGKAGDKPRLDPISLFIQRFSAFSLIL